MSKILTSYKGNNTDLIKEVSDLYIKDGEKVIDITWGKGVFWKKVDLSRLDFYATDLITNAPNGNHNLNNLPYLSDTFDHVILDPPYAHTPGNMHVNKNYKNKETTKGMYHTDIMSQLYVRGMMEARRLLKHKGYLWVKCQDEIESGKQKWSHIEIYNIATQSGFYGKDMFVLTRNGSPTTQHKQLHARKNHSYLWIFQKII